MVVAKKPQLPKRHRLIELGDGSTVEIRPPGILYEMAAFGKFPDLVDYYDKIKEFDAENKRRTESGEAAVEERERDRALEYRLSVLLVEHCCVEPRFTSDRATDNGAVFVDDLDTRDFWTLVGSINALQEELKKREAQEIDPLPESPAS